LIHGITREPTYLLDNNQIQHGKVSANNAATHRLSLAFAGSAGSVAAETVAQQQSHTGVGEDTLLHGEALLVVTAGDAEDLWIQSSTNKWRALVAQQNSTDRVDQ
jgi:hypothetical protein